MVPEGAAEVSFTTGQVSHLFVHAASKELQVSLIKHEEGLLDGADLRALTTCDAATSNGRLKTMLS
jgi:hypothetical protein